MSEDEMMRCEYTYDCSSNKKPCSHRMIHKRKRFCKEGSCSGVHAKCITLEEFAEKICNRVQKSKMSKHSINAKRIISNAFPGSEVV